MAIVSFWAEGKKETAQTLSLAALTTYMAIEHNYKILVVDACFGDDTFEDCFWDSTKSKTLEKKLNEGKVDVSSGVEGVISAVTSNRLTPDTVRNFPRVVLKDNRLDILLRQKTSNPSEYEKNLLYYKDFINIANKYYDLVFVDLPKGLESEGVRQILEISDVVIVTMCQRLRMLDDYLKLKDENEIFAKKAMIPLIGRYDRNSKYNAKNVARYVGQKRDICTIPYNTLLYESADEHTVANYFLSVRLSGTNDRNVEFVKNLKNVDETLIYKLQELQMNM